MKNLTILFLAIIFAITLSACGYFGENEEIGFWYEKVYNWQDRETECLGQPFYQSNEDFTFNVALLSEIRSEVIGTVKYEEDEEGYWQTSCETEERGKGDCEDVAIAIWRKLRDNGFPDDIIGMVIIEWYPDGERQSHMFAVVYLSDPSIEELPTDPDMEGPPSEGEPEEGPPPPPGGRSALHLTDRDFYILDNGALHKCGVMSKDIQKASDVLGPSIKLILGFNLFSTWNDFPTFGRWAL